MEGGDREGIPYHQPYHDLRNNFSFYQQFPPLLWSHQTQQSVANNNESIFTQHGGYYDGTSGYNSNVFTEQRLMDNIVFNEENAVHWNNKEQEMVISSAKEMGKNAKERTCSTTMLVKGQWTEEEDRNLMKLVKQFGLKRWAQIAENMVGRAGKQCRERWHNHLRPDIKKETWSEEEEVMLVEAHKQIGNKWAEIGKRIPGRTENAIKNHWNASKRRQNSRRNKLKKEESKYRSNVLQDYIRSKYFSDDINTMTMSTTTPNDNNMKNAYPYSDDDDSSSLLTNQTYDEEMNFMQKLFGNNSLDGKVTDEANMTAEHQPYL
uniref:Myb119 n=2 Tax=Solanum tuberosum TaxID=4113 RepID=M1DRH7_SOLTU